MGSNIIELNYESLQGQNEKITSYDLEKIQALLLITQKEGSIIYICHPKHLFDVLIEDEETKEIKSVDLDSMNVEKMFSINDYGQYSIVDQICNKHDNQLTYVMKKAKHMVNKYQELGKEEYSYPFAVLEEVENKGSIQYLFRGIIKCHKEGYELAFGPYVLKSLPKESVWEKALKFGDNN